MIRPDMLITNAKEIVTCRGPAPKTGSALNDLSIIKNGAIAIKKGKILWVGETKDLPDDLRKYSKEEISAQGRVIMPGFVDPHTHLVFGGSREEEFSQKLRGVSYLDILKNGGGILSTVRSTRKANHSTLLEEAIGWLSKMLESGTTTVEIKSGYGLSREQEEKILGVIGELRANYDNGLADGIVRIIPDIVSTFLGAHAFPPEMGRREYIEEVLDTMLLVREQGLAEFCDVFCEENAFSLEEAKEILERAVELGFKPKIHAGEFTDLGGAELAASLKAVSLDHGEHISEKGIAELAEKRVPVVLMPGVNFHLGSEPADARALINAGVPVALATDFNPGSSPIFSMRFIIQLACRMYGMTYEEAINAATINAAYAIDRADVVGSIETGKQADLLMFRASSYKEIPYWISNYPWLEGAVKRGRRSHFITAQFLG